MMSFDDCLMTLKTLGSSLRTNDKNSPYHHISLDLISLYEAISKDTVSDSLQKELFIAFRTMGYDKTVKDDVLIGVDIKIIPTLKNRYYKRYVLLEQENHLNDQFRFKKPKFNRGKNVFFFKPLLP